MTPQMPKELTLPTVVLPEPGEDEPMTSGGDVIFQCVCDSPDPTPAQRHRLIELCGALDFWDDPAEDVYGPEDGEPV